MIPARSLRRGAVLAALSLPMISPALAGDDLGAPSVERVVSLPSFAGTPPARPTWSPDSTRVAFLWNDRAMPFRDVWVVDADGKNLRRLTRLAPEAPAETDSPDTSLAALGRRMAGRVDPGIGTLAWTPDSTRVLFVHDGAVLAVPAEGGEPEAWLTGGGGKSSLSFSPDGRRLAYLEGGDLWLHDPESGQTRQLTELGRASIATVPVGAFAGRDAEIRRFSWSPGGERIAFEFIDRRDIRRVPIPAYLHADEPFLHEVRRAYPPDPGEPRRIGVYETGPDDWEFLDLAGSDSRHVYEFDFSPDGTRLLVHRGADVAEERWIEVVDLATGEPATVWHDRRARRIYPAFSAHWSADGGEILFIGDHEGFYRLYAIAAAGGQPRALTSGDFDVAGSRSSAYVEVSRPGGEVFFVSSAHSPYERHLYRLAPQAAQAERVTVLPGLHQPVVSPDGRRLATVRSSDDRPAELYLGAVGETRPEVRVTRSPPAEFERYTWAKPRYVSFPSRIDDYTLHARIVEPPNLDRSKKYPVLIGNIYSNTVRNAWDPDRPTTNLQQQMALAGEYIHVQVDLRGSLGYGVDFREAFQGDWGGDDLEDLHSAVEYLAGLDYVDPDRIGIWGNSYGGLMVLAALFKKPGLFAAGVAGAPAVDIWHFTGYDRHLTRRPETHPEIFAAGSLLDLGEDLADPLLIIHGMHDDIVPYKTTLMMAEKLMLLEKDFELITIPNAAHWWAWPEHYAVYTFRRLADFFHRHVPPGPRPTGQD